MIIELEGITWTQWLGLRKAIFVCDMPIDGWELRNEADCEHRQLLASGVRVRADQYGVFFVDDCYGLEGASRCPPSMMDKLFRA